MTAATARQRPIAAAGEEQRFDRVLATLVGIVEPDSRPAARPGPIARFVRSHRGSVALGFAGVAAIGGLVAIGVRSLPAPVARDQPASVMLAVPAIERPPTSVRTAAPATPVVVAEQPEPASNVRTPHPDRTQAIAASRVRLASATRRDVPRPAPTFGVVREDVRPPTQPVQVAAVDRPASVVRADRSNDGEGAGATPSITVASPDRREPAAERVERRDNVDALRQLRHQW